MTVYVCYENDHYEDPQFLKVFTDEDRAREWLRDVFLEYRKEHPKLVNADFTWTNRGEEEGYWEWYDCVSDSPYGHFSVKRIEVE